MRWLRMTLHSLDLSTRIPPAAGEFTLSADHPLKRTSPTRIKKTGRAGKVIDTTSQPFDSTLIVTTLSEYNPERAVQIPIAPPDCVTVFCHLIAVSCIEPYRTPAR